MGKEERKRAQRKEHFFSRFCLHHLSFKYSQYIIVFNLLLGHEKCNEGKLKIRHVLPEKDLNCGKFS